MDYGRLGSHIILNSSKAAVVYRRQPSLSFLSGIYENCQNRIAIQKRDSGLFAPDSLYYEQALAATPIGAKLSALPRVE